MQKFTKGRKNPIEPQCVESLAVDCDRFRTILAEDEKPVLTICEKKGMSKQVIGKKVLVNGSAVRSPFLCLGEANDTRQFVNRDSATIGHSRETLIDDDSNHRDLCMASGSGTQGKIFDFLRPVLADTREAIAKDSPLCKFITLPYLTHLTKPRRERTDLYETR